MNDNIGNYIYNINFKEFDNLYDYKEYYLLKNNNIYKIVIYANNNEIIINTKKYIISLNLYSITKLFKRKDKSIYESYEYLITKFDENKIQIGDIINKDYLKLIIFIGNNEIDNIEIILRYNKDNKDYLFSEIYKFQNEINNLKNQINNICLNNKKFKNEFEYLKSSNKNKNCKTINLLSNITNDSYADFDLDNTFTTFKSLNKISYLIYSTSEKLIVSYNLDKEQKIAQIKSNHNNYITNLRHYLDKIKKRDLILSISAKDNNLKLWQINNWECLLNINEVNKAGYLDSACLLFDKNDTYIITSNSNKGQVSEKIKLYNLEGNLIRAFNKSNEQTYFLDSFHDDNDDNNIYIISGNEDCVRSFNYNNNELYKKYFDNKNGAHICIIMFKDNKKLKMIESCDDGNIRIWNFHSGILLKKIKIGARFLFGICLWNSNYIYVGCEDKTIQLIEINKGQISKSFLGHNDDVLTLKKITLPKYGDCLISQGRKRDQIKLWVYN